MKIIRPNDNNNYNTNKKSNSYNKNNSKNSNDNNNNCNNFCILIFLEHQIFNIMKLYETVFPIF